MPIFRPKTVTGDFARYSDRVKNSKDITEYKRLEKEVFADKQKIKNLSDVGKTNDALVMMVNTLEKIKKVDEIVDRVYIRNKNCYENLKQNNGLHPTAKGEIRTMAKIKDGQNLAEPVRYSQKDKMHHLAGKSRKGATDNNGNQLSDFARGANFGRSQEIGKSLGAYAYNKAKEEGNFVKMAEMKATRAEIKAQKLRAREEYKASKGKM